MPPLLFPLLVDYIDPFEAIAILTLIGTGYIAYRSKANSLTTAREHEQFLNNRIGGATFVEEPFIVNLDMIEVHERTGLVYRLKRILFQPLEGSVMVRVRWQHQSLDEDWWDSGYADILRKEFDIGFEHVATEQVADQAVSAFELETLEQEEIIEFVGALPNFGKALTQSVDVSIEPYRSPFRFKT